MNTIADNISIYRKAIGYTQDQLADELNMNRVILGYWEIGKRSIPDAALPLLAKVLRVDLYELLEEDPEIVFLVTRFMPHKNDSAVHIKTLQESKKIIINYLKMNKKLGKSSS